MEIENKPLKALLSEDGIWFHGRNGIYNIEHFDARTGTLVGLTVYDFSPGFDAATLDRDPDRAMARRSLDDRSARIERTLRRQAATSSRARCRLRRARLPERPQDFQIMEKDPGGAELSSRCAITSASSAGKASTRRNHASTCI